METVEDWFYGRRTVLEILKSNKSARKILVAKNFSGKEIQEIIGQAKEKKIPHQLVPQSAFNFLRDCNHQGVAIQLSSAITIDFKEFAQQISNDNKTFVVLLDEIQDPQNVGAIIRSAVCFGASGVVITRWRSAGITSAVVKSSSGAIAHIKIAEVSNLNYAIEKLKGKGFSIYGADVSGSPINEIQFQLPLAIVLGNEYSGIKHLVKKNCDALVSIPQKKVVTSLNVSVSAGIIFQKISESFF